MIDVVPVAFMVLGFYPAGRGDPAPLLAWPCFLALTFMGSILGCLAIGSARNNGRPMKLSASVALLKVPCFLAPLVQVLVSLANGQKA